VRQGEEGRNFYVVVQGAPLVRVAHADGSLLSEHELAPGCTFGEVALLFDSVRSASVLAGASPVRTWVLSRSAFKRTLSNSAFERRKTYSALLAKVKPLSLLDGYARSVLADALEPCAWRAGAAILRQGEANGARFHIVVKGRVRVMLDGQQQPVAHLAAGDYFGELSLLLAEAAPSASVVAESGEACHTIALDRSAFRRLLGEAVQSALSVHIRTYVHGAGDGDLEAGEGPASTGKVGKLADSLAKLAVAPRPAVQFAKDVRARDCLLFLLR